MPAEYRDWFFRRRPSRYHDKEVVTAGMVWPRWRPRSVYDAGCGIGSFLAGFYQLGCRVAGSDVSRETAAPYMRPAIRDLCRAADLSEPWPPSKTYELVLCINVLEHIAPERTGIALANLRALTGRRLWFSAGTLDQRNVGVGHVNCHSRSTWMRLLRQAGFRIDDAETRAVDSMLRRAGDNLSLYRRQIVARGD